jgi:hypothetical protein
LVLSSSLTADGGFRLLARNPDGSAIDSNRLANIDLLSSTNLAFDVGGWTKLTNPVVFTNGQLLLESPLNPALPRLFFRTQEKP